MQETQQKHINRIIGSTHDDIYSLLKFHKKKYFYKKRNKMEKLFNILVKNNRLKNIPVFTPICLSIPWVPETT